MSQNDIDALRSIRASLVTERRTAAAAADAQTVIRIQRDIAMIDAASSDEQALGQHEKAEQAITRAMRRVPDPRNVEEVSLLNDTIRVSD